MHALLARIVHTASFRRRRRSPILAELVDGNEQCQRVQTGGDPTPKRRLSVLAIGIRVEFFRIGVAFFEVEIFDQIDRFDKVQAAHDGQLNNGPNRDENAE